MNEQWSDNSFVCITNETVNAVKAWMSSQEGKKALAESMELARKQSSMIEAMSKVEEDMVRVPFTPQLH